MRKFSKFKKVNFDKSLYQKDGQIRITQRTLYNHRNHSIRLFILKVIEHNLVLSLNY